MKLEQSFAVAAPLDTVWAALIDVERVAPCLPGAEITETGEDGTYRGNFSVRLGPTTAAYRGQLKIEEADEQAHRSVMRATGQDKRGQGSAKATIVSVLAPEGDATRVDVQTDFTITGRLARFGRGGMIQDISNRLMKDFGECLQRSIEANQPARDAPPEAAAPAAAPSADDDPVVPANASPGTPPRAPAPSRSARPAAKPVGGFSLVIRALVDRVKRILNRER